MRKLFLLLSVLFVVSCSSGTEEPAPVIKYTLTTSANPTTGGTITPASGQHTEGATVSITATPAAEYLFLSWTGATGTTATTSVVMNSNKTVTANFVKKKYALTTTIEGEGTVSEKIIKAGAATDYNSGTVVELTATPKDGWEFKEWSGDLTGSDNPKEITIDKAKTVKAVFVKKIQYALTIEIQGEGTVSQKVIKEGTATDYNSGTVVELTATPKAEWQFKEWSGDLTGSDNPKEITIDKAKTVKAVFISNSGGEPFTTTWAIETGDFKFPLKDYADITIDWGDDSTSNHTDGVFPTHSYASSATFTIKVTVNDAAKDIGRMNIANNNASKFLIRTVENWGEGKWSNFEQAFYGATNLTIPATDEPDLSLGPSMINAFTNCSSLVGGTFDDWITSNVTDMYGMFTGASAFNGDISLWDTSSVSNMGKMFYYASSFNRDINTSGSSWDTGAVTNMYGMFLGASVFDGDISLWDTSNVNTMYQMFREASAFDQDISSWNTSAVTNMKEMFFQATSFNRNINTSGSSWDTSSVARMDAMFRGASAFDGDISSWDTSSVETIGMDQMFMYTNAFNQNLSGWCVTNISSEPSNFSTSSALTDANKPLWGTCPGNSYTIAVTASSNSDYTLSGKDRNGDVSGNDPSLTFKVGDEVTFSVNATGHPFYLKTVVGTGTDNQISGVTNNGATSGSVVWTPTAAGTYYYICSLHSGMVGTITIQN
jgi:surface protein